jgi:hypothetical protein
MPNKSAVGDDLLGIGGPDERLGVVVGFGKEALDSGLELVERSVAVARG